LKARLLRLDCLHLFANTQAFWASVPGLVTIHDLQAFRKPSPFPVHKRIYLRLMITAAVKQARMLLPISQATADDLHRTLNVEFERMVVIPHSLTSQFKPGTPDEVLRFRERFRLPDKFWLYVAHFYAYKNHER